MEKAINCLKKKQQSYKEDISYFKAMARPEQFIAVINELQKSYDEFEKAIEILRNAPNQF